uniref:Uncharacterized protein n=1 Tax=Arundo donax TaxID=35708 RepID=A0A0A9DJ15_ARUDO
MLARLVTVHAPSLPGSSVQLSRGEPTRA